MTPEELKASRPRHQELLRRKYNGEALTDWELAELKKLNNAVRAAIITEFPPAKKILDEGEELEEFALQETKRLKAVADEIAASHEEDKKWADQSHKTMIEATSYG